MHCMMVRFNNIKSQDREDIKHANLRKMRLVQVTIYVVVFIQNIDFLELSLLSFYSAQNNKHNEGNSQSEVRTSS